MADSKLAEVDEGNGNASPLLSRILTAGVLGTFLYNSKSLWRISPKVAKVSFSFSVFTTMYHLWKRYYLKSDSFSPSPWITSIMCVTLLVGHASKRAVKLAAPLSRLLVFLCLPSFAIDAFESLKDADTCAIFAMGIGALYPGRRSSLAAVMILLMLTGGEALEDYAVFRAGRDLEDLIKNLRLEKTVRKVLEADIRTKPNPDTVDQTFRKQAGSQILPSLPRTTNVPTESVRPNDIIVLKESEIVPVDGYAISPWNVYNTQLSSSMSSKARRQRVPVVDASNVTGESYRRQACADGDLVYSGSIVLSGPPLILKVNKPATESVLALLKKELSYALGQHRSSRMEDICADIAGYFTPFALCLSAFVLVQRQYFSSRRYRRVKSELIGGRNLAWESALGVLMGATPCPLSIGVPVAFLSGTSSAAKKNITVKSGDALEKIAKTTVCVFDKTGTLTFGRLMATNLKHLSSLFGEKKGVSSSNYLEAQDFSDKDFDGSHQASPKDSWTSFKVLEVLAIVEASSGSVHPIAKALIQKKNITSINDPNLVSSNLVCDDAKVHPGEGLEGTVIEEQAGAKGHNTIREAYSVFIGSKSYVINATKNTSITFDTENCENERNMDESVITVYFAFVRHSRGPTFDHSSHKTKGINHCDERHTKTTFIVHGTIDLMDCLRPGAKQVIDELQKKLGIRTMILSGDSSVGLRIIAEKLGVKECYTCLPHEKSNFIKKLMEEEGEIVTMVGDGVNDAAALSVASVGICIGLNDLSSASADVVVTGDEELQKVVQLIKLSQKTVNVARDGVRIGMSVSMMQMCLAAVGIVPPFVNAILQEFVDLGAILNALRVLMY